MKKQILSLGHALSRKEQKNVMGGGDLQPVDQSPGFTDPNIIPCSSSADCPAGRACVNYGDLRFDDTLAKYNNGAGWVWTNSYYCEI